MDNKSWLTVDDIMKDLRMPRKTKRGLDRHFIVSGKSPPRNLIGTEETEEEYLGHGAAGGDVSTPDLSLIKKMLDIVNDEEKQRMDSDINNQNSIIEISKVNYTKKVASQPRMNASGDCLPTEKVIATPVRKNRKPLHSRNAAFSSIMENMTESERQDIITENQNFLHSPRKKEIKTLQTPKDFISSKSPITSLSATNMFRSKKKTCLSPEKVEQDSDSSKFEKCSASSSSSSSQAYVPSSYAQEKYKEYMNRTSDKNTEPVVSNYWEEIVQQMKDIEAKRLTKDDIDRTNHPELTDEQFKRLEPVLLPMHRHHITDDCIVCAVKSERDACRKIPS